MMNVMFTFDHRAFDGYEQGMILRDLQLYLENPELMLI
jgi:pyruvate/2-oxoglutarate dehydrogenase complex dihydrolipoamide acyltransferase (E2) component